MIHYTQQEWIDFNQHNLPEEIELKMEQHLQTCNSCMDLWLGLITEAEIDVAAVIVPDDFSRSTMNHIQAQANSVAPLSSNRSKRRRLLAYYTAAAAITLMLVSGGVFQTVVNGLANRPAQQISALEGPARLLYTWPAQFNKTSTEYFEKMDLNKSLKEVKK